MTGAGPRRRVHTERPGVRLRRHRRPMTVAGAGRGRRRPAGRRAESGLMTLEWLLIVGAAAGLAATSVVAVQRVVDDTAEVRPDPLVRLLQADVAAAFVAAEAQAAFDAEDPPRYPPDVDDVFKDRCVNGIFQDFREVAERAAWTSPAGIDRVPGNEDDVAALCVVTPRRNLGGGG